MPRTREESLKWIDRDHETLSIRRQCQILGVHRSQLYYEPVPESNENLKLMRLIDEQYLKTPFWGSRNMSVFPSKRTGRPVNRKKTQHFMRKMGLEGLATDRPRASPSRVTKCILTCSETSSFRVLIRYGAATSRTFLCIAGICIWSP